MKLSPKAKLLYGTCIALILIGCVAGLIILISSLSSSDQSSEDSSLGDASHIASGKNCTALNLDDYSNDLVITEAGAFCLSGQLSHTIVVDAPDAEVELILDGINVNNSDTAAIAAVAGKKLTINTTADTENYLSDGGSSEYDGCIYSEVELILGGDGTLIIDGNQVEGEGIATEAKNLTINSGKYLISSNDDGLNAGGNGATITVNGGELYIDAGGDGIDSNQNAIFNGGTVFVMGSDTGGDAAIDTETGFEINGGIIIALGSDMLESPLESSGQNSLAFTLDSTISADSLVALLSNEQPLISFQPAKGFRTLIISSPKLISGDYELYQLTLRDGLTNEASIILEIDQDSIIDKQPITVNNQTTFSVSQTVNVYGNNFGPRRDGPANSAGPAGRPSPR